MTTDRNIDNFLSTTIDAGGDLSPAQAAQLLSLATQGDTGAPSPELSSGPAAAPAPADESSTIAAPTDDSLTADNAVILAKDGKHTISYDKLVQARETARAAQTEAQALAAQLQAAQQQLADLTAQAQARANAGQAPTETDNQVAAAQAAIEAGANPALFGDFSEEALAKGITQLVEQQVAARMEAINAKLKPIEQQAATDATTAHFNAIYSAHPDADSLVESQEFAVWKGAQPAIVRAALDQALTQGSSTDVIEVFSAFKAATQQPPAAAGKGALSPAEAAKAAIAKAAAPTPASLSDIPGGRVAGTNVFEAMNDMNSHELLSATSNMSAEQIEAWLNSQI
ncbi:hypothetical protein [Aquabacterium sp.]|uniref:hypothetical protein n=1 Tax=Aquabacterium sp. TaxID=1872578 RepID=UPI0026298FEB|nr:hypothetical protein [Aquabacterium sp.]MDD2978134.1 hypothetical protein [Aquabacterium sp.]